MFVVIFSGSLHWEENNTAFCTGVKPIFECEYLFNRVSDKTDFNRGCDGNFISVFVSAMSWPDKNLSGF